MGTKTAEQEKLQATTSPKIKVTADNFTRAETDFYFSNVIEDVGIGKFRHYSDVTKIDEQTVIRMNRDTVYSAAVFDLDAGPVTIILPDPGPRFMSMQVINEDQYTMMVHYNAGRYTLRRDEIGTRYVMVAIRILVNPGEVGDIEKVRKLQNAVEVEQANTGQFDIPNWDRESQSKVRDALLLLGSSLPDLRHMFGTKEQVNPVRFLIGSAMGWGGNPENEATYLNVTPAQNDGVTVHQLTVKDVPVDGFWSISLYNEKGYFEKNDREAYSINNLTAKKNADGSITVQFGGCTDKTGNCLPIMPGWNYIVRLYRPHPEILNGKWKFPEAQPLE
jgi:hypothetical protein